jgi:hypothetical protein
MLILGHKQKAYTPRLVYAPSNLQVKNFSKEFSVFTGYNVDEFATKSYIERVNLLKERFVGKKLVFHIHLKKGDRSERMLLSLVGAEELPSNYGGVAKKWKSCAGS